MMIEPLKASYRAGTVGRLAYFVAGSALLLLKFGIDWTVAGEVFHRPWSPADYIAPGASLGLLFMAPHERVFYSTMLLIALPFIACGVTLTAMRLRSVGIASGWSVLFFVPGVNFLMFAVLTALPRREIPLAQVAPEAALPAPPVGDAPTLAYAADDRLPLPWLARILPANHAAADAVAVIVPAIIGLAATFISIELLQNYGWGVFVGVPFAIGLMAALIHVASEPCRMRTCIGFACLSLTVYGAALLFVALEGAGCLIMAAPLAYPLAIIGALVGGAFRRRPSRLHDAGRVVWLMLLFLPLFMGAEKLATSEAPLFAITSSVDVEAPPSQVWPNVIAFGEIPPPTDWLFRSGVAYPMRAQIAGHGVGAVRKCVFSTGAFEEPITAWDEPTLLKFSVTSNPPPMKEWSPYSDIHPPHLENFLVSSGGQFKLVELPGGRTRLEGTTWYRHHMWPAAYWQLWSDHIIHRIHLRVLNHVKARSESSPIEGSLHGLAPTAQ